MLRSTRTGSPGVAHRRFAVIGAGCLAFTAVFAAWLVSGAGSAGQRQLISDLAFVLVPAVAAASCWQAGRRDADWRSGWRWIALGCLVWAAASLIWGIYEVGLGIDAPFPSPADFGYIGYAAPITVGLLRFPASMRSALSRVRLTLDTVVIAGGLLFVSAVWVLHPVLTAPHAGLLERVDAALYPLADVTVAGVVLARALVLSSSRRSGWTLLGLGLLVLSATDSVYVARTWTGDYQPGHLLDAGWVASFLLVTVAAQVPITSTPAAAATGAAAEPPGLVQQLLPYVPAGLAGWAFMDQLPDFHRGGPYFCAAGVLAVLVVVRQVAVVADHASLTRDLERLVARRTGELTRREQWWKDVVRNLSDVVIVIDTSGAVLYCSPSVRTALGEWPLQLQSTDELIARLHRDDVDAVAGAVAPVAEGRGRQGFVECRIRRADGNWGWFELTAVGQLASDAGAEGVLDGAVLTLHDVTERRRLTDRLAHEAFHDALTGLPNRSLLMRRVEESLQRPGEPALALLLIDLDDFKLINDRHGHAAGDVVLQAIAQRLRKAVRSSDTVARLGGDEFAITVRATREQAVATAHRIAAAVQAPVAADGRSFHVRASVGVVFAENGSEETPHSLLAHADIALYEAKAHGRGGVIVIAGEDRQRAANQVYMREQVAQPDLEQFTVVYQPVVDLRDGRVRGVEALLRWHHPRLGEISPAVFVPLAEQGGSIHTLGWFVLETTCRQLAQWAADVPDRRMAAGVNVSILQLEEPGFARRVGALIDAHRLTPDQIVLEVTEQALARDFETAVEVVTELRALGVSVAVDDFGTGYSSLRYLHRFDADVVKIDRSFIATLGGALPGSAHTRKIVRSVLQMAESLDLQSIAEGIETQEQLAVVRSLGCELAQGYLFSRPVPAAQVAELLRSGRDFPVGGGAAEGVRTPWQRTGDAATGSVGAAVGQTALDVAGSF